MDNAASSDNRDTPVVILCGGEGTRFQEESQYRPKPLAEIGGWPILCHIMEIYARHGFRRFILCLGYKGELIRDFFVHYDTRLRDFTVRLGEGVPRFLDADRGRGWEVTCIDTGRATMTGARIKRIEHLVQTDHFLVTYGDGVADIDIGALFDFHRSHGGIGTVTGVVPNSQFGQMVLEGDRVTAFAEKPKLPTVINGGFFAFRRSFFDYLAADPGCVLEQEPLQRLAVDGQLRVFRHGGFWQCMDTFKDYRQLNELWASGEARWAGTQAGAVGIVP
jgi:glucose-1-phosphate cytidylyltransferase